MQEVFEKIIEKLNSKKAYFQRFYECEGKSEHDADLNKSTQLAFDDAIEIVKQEAEKYNSGWSPVEEELPKDGDNRYYMCIVENHEEDLPMYCQYDEECGFGLYKDIYDEHTLGFVDCEFNTNEELAEFIEQVSTDSMETISFGTKEYEEIWEHKETALQWLQSEVEEQDGY